MCERQECGCARSRNGDFSSSVISCDASVCNDWEEVGRVLASVRFCKGGIGEPEESVDVAGAFSASKCASPFLSEIVVRSGPRRVEFEATPSVLEPASVSLCGVTVGNALVVFSPLTLGFCGEVHRSMIVDITPGMSPQISERNPFLASASRDLCLGWLETPLAWNDTC